MYVVYQISAMNSYDYLSFLADVHIKSDEYPRKQTTIEGLANLKTVFKEGTYAVD